MSARNPTTDPRAAGELDILIGRCIRARRKALGLSQTCLADRLGVTFQPVQKYEKGVNRISLARAVHLADVFGCQVEALYDPAEVGSQ